MINQIHTRCAANKSKMHYVLRSFVFTSVFTSMSYCLLVSPGVFASTVAADSERTAQKILHLLDYVSVDYVNVVKNGVVTNEDEYREQMEFTGRLTALVDQLPASSEKPSLRNEAAQLRKAVEQRAAGDKVAQLCNAMSVRLIEVFQVGVAPRTAPTLDGAQRLFQDNCSSCHGMQGYGNGPQAAGLQPVPANFHDRDRQQHRSIFSLYNTITLGVTGTAMPAFSDLTNEQRWQLAFYVSNFFAADAERAKGEAILRQSGSDAIIGNLRQLTQTTPAQMGASSGADGMAVLAYLRANPQQLQAEVTKPLRVAQDNLTASLTAYQHGDSKTAYDLAVAAYLEGFELAETTLNSVAPDLRLQIEKAMMQYRELIKGNASVDAVQQANAHIENMLASAHEKLHSETVSSTVNFLSALLILLREGIEAILILAAISAVLIKTGRNDMLRYLHVGWISALVLGGLTWLAARNFINISGAGRELTEGVTALVAAAMLIYVGFWLHNQTNAMQWQQFIRTKVSQSLTGSTLTGLAVVAFLAVYREVFESILFFETLWLQAEPAGQSFIVYGILTAAALLGIIAWGIFKFSIRLPLKLFFRVNAVFLYVLAVVFAGKGIAALQKADKLPINPVDFFQIDALGIYPNAQALGAQAALIVIAILFILSSRIRMNRNQIGSHT